MSPRPRFDSLDDTKRSRILDAAEEEFGDHGFARASLNRIIRAAGISKGAVYYYFDDKRDLFTTLIERRLKEHLGSPLDPAGLDATTFWPEIEAWIERTVQASVQRPTLMRLVRTVLSMTGDIRRDPRLAPLYDLAYQTIRDLIARGQTLGLVRDDLELELLVKITVAADEAIDRWLIERFDQFGDGDVRRIVDTYIDTTRRLLAPSAPPEFP